MKIKLLFILFFFTTALVARPNSEKVSIKNECLKTLYELDDAMLNFQIIDDGRADYGALRCDHCNVLHTRAGEAVFPFAVAWKQGGEEKYLRAAIALGNWLIRRQQTDGSWKETPEEWTGTTADQLLMMACAYPILQPRLSQTEKASWKNSIKGAADYLTKVMRPEFASINYCATTTSSLVMANKVIPNQKYIDKAKVLAHQVVAKMDMDGFITGEGGRVRGVKYGVDVGYNIDMSLWGLGLYARVAGDTLVDRYVRNALKTHLWFVYPNGIIDGSWGIRCNKWTTFGSATADGCQILFSLFAQDDSRYRTAAMRNLQYLRTNFHNGYIGYGPHYWRIFEIPPCIYPTFVRAKNLALAVEFGEQEAGETAPLPTEQTGWAKLFPTVDVVLVRTKNFMATVTAYRYKDLAKWEKSKYMHRPTGGSISDLWVAGHGLLQASSVTEYHRWEPMHFPEMGDIKSLTPRIEFTDGDHYYTNLYEFDGRISLDKKDDHKFIVATSGELKDKTQIPGGIAYILRHTFNDDFIEKEVTLRFHDNRTPVEIVEPFVWNERMTFRQIDARTIRIDSPDKSFEVKLVKGDAKLELGTNREQYRSVYPALKCFPICLKVRPKRNEFLAKVRYRISPAAE